MTKNPFRDLIEYVEVHSSNYENPQYSYVTKLEKNNTEIVEKSNTLNRMFYNSFNVVAAIENTNMQLNNQNVLFSNTSVLETNKKHLTNHVGLTQVQNTIVFDSEFFENPYKRFSVFESETIVPVIIPSQLAFFLLDENENLHSLMYKEIELEGKPNSQYIFRVAGIWDSLNPNQNISQYNDFYSEFEDYVFFVNNSIYKLGGLSTDVDIYLIFNNSYDKNLEFYHYIENTIGKKNFQVSIPIFERNNFYINSIPFYEVFEVIKGEIKSYSFTFTNIVIFLTSITALIIFELLILVKCSTFTKTYDLYLIICGLVLGTLLSLYAVKLLTHIIHFEYLSFNFSPSGILFTLIIVLLNIFFLIYRVVKVSRVGNQAKNGNNKVLKNETILIVTFEDLSGTSAGSIRVNNFINIFESLKYKCVHIGFFPDKLSKENNYGMKITKWKVLNFVLSPLMYTLFARRIYKEQAYSKVFIYSPLPIFTTLALYSLFNSLDVEIINDVTEFQNLSQVNIKKPGWFYLSNVVTNKYIISYGDKVIVISNYLNDYFRSKGCLTLQIPPLFEPKLINSVTWKESNKIRFGYLGSPGKKDNLKICIEGFQLFLASNPNYIDRIEVIFHGLSKGDKDRLLDHIDDKYKNCFRFGARLSREEIANVYRELDFTFLMRPPNKRYAKAGFPSKIVESLFYGVPVVSNRTSDLVNSLIDGTHCYFVNEYTAESFSKTIVKVFAFKSSIISMKEQSFKLANERFNLEKYRYILADFISK